MAINSWTMRPLTALEVTAMNGYTHRGVISAADLTDAVDGEVQSLVLGPIPLGSKIQIMTDPLVPFENTGEAGNDTTTVTFEDSDGTDLLAAQQMNRNGTEIVVPAEGTLSGVYAADKFLWATWTPKAATKLSELNKGEIVYFVRIVCPIPYVNAAIPTTAGVLR